MAVEVADEGVQHLPLVVRDLGDIRRIQRIQTLSHGSEQSVDQVKQQKGGKKAANQQQQSKTDVNAGSNRGFLSTRGLL